MADLISREALLAEYDRVHVGEPGGARKLIAEAPAVDAVPVVRCGECIHRVRGSWAKCTGRRPYEFCSDGERRFKDATD